MIIEFFLKDFLYIVLFQDILVYLFLYIVGEVGNRRRYFKYALLISLFCTLMYAWINILATALIWLFGVVFIFHLTKKINISLLLLSTALLLYIFASYFMCMLIEFFFNISDISTELNFAAGSTLYILMSLGIKYFFGKVSRKFNITEKMKWSGAIVTMITCFSYYIVIVMERFVGQETVLGQTNTFFIVSYGLISLLIFFGVVYYFHKEYEAREKQNELFYLKEYTGRLEANYTEMRSFRHDYQNILMSMEEYIAAGDIEELNDYFYTKIKKSSHVIEQNDFKLSQLSNVRVSEMKSILASKLIVSQEKGVNTEIEVKEPVEEIKVDSIMLVRSLGIILDNAIEAASMIEGGFVRVAVLKNAGKIVIVVANSCREDIPKLFKLKQEGFSTKGDQRGVGLSNLDRLIANEKRTMLETKIERGIFTQILSMGE